MEGNMRLFYGMTAFDFMEDANTQNSNEKHFSDEVLLSGPMTRKEIAQYFRETELEGEKGWRVKSTECEFSREHENCACPYDYYWISATFIRR